MHTWTRLLLHTPIRFMHKAMPSRVCSRRTQLGSETIPAKLIRVSPATINTYLGSSSPFRDR